MLMLLMSKPMLVSSHWTRRLSAPVAATCIKCFGLGTINCPSHSGRGCHRCAGIGSVTCDHCGGSGKSK